MTPPVVSFTPYTILYDWLSSFDSVFYSGGYRYNHITPTVAAAFPFIVVGILFLVVFLIRSFRR